MDKFGLKTIVITAVLGCALTVHAQTAKVITVKDDRVPQIEGRTIIDVALKMDAPFSTAVLTIQNNGSAIYRAKQHGQEEIRDSGTLTQSQISTLIMLLEDAAFLNMKNRPQNADDLLDGSTHTITVRIFPLGGHPELADVSEHAVNCYQFSCEEKFLKLKERISKLWGKGILEIGI